MLDSSDRFNPAKAYVGHMKFPLDKKCRRIKSLEGPRWNQVHEQIQIARHSNKQVKTEITTYKTFLDIHNTLELVSHSYTVYSAPSGTDYTHSAYHYYPPSSYSNSSSGTSSPDAANPLQTRSPRYRTCTQPLASAQTAAPCCTRNSRTARRTAACSARTASARTALGSPSGSSAPARTGHPRGS